MPESFFPWQPVQSFRPTISRRLRPTPDDTNVQTALARRRTHTAEHEVVIYPYTSVSSSLPLQRAFRPVKKCVKPENEEIQIPREITDQPGHHGPSNTVTSSQVIGQYLDLMPRPPLPYRYTEYDGPPIDPDRYNLLVNFTPTNISNHPPIPDHAFAIPREELKTHDGEMYMKGWKGACFSAEPPGVIQPKPDTFRTSQTCMGQIVGELGKGERFLPYLHPTGLELNRYNSGRGGDWKAWLDKQQCDARQQNRDFPRRVRTDAVGAQVTRTGREIIESFQREGTRLSGSASQGGQLGVHHSVHYYGDSQSQ